MKKVLVTLTVAVFVVGGCSSAGAVAPASNAAEPTVSPSAAIPTATARPSPTPAGPESPPPDLVPEKRTIGGVPATVVPLGDAAEPIDAIAAFGSIWVANHHQDNVSRIDPKTGREIVRIPVGPGPGWFAATDDALWVSNQNGVGVTRIDPATNTAVTSVGDKPPCGPLTVAGGSVWQFACDSDTYVRIDPASNQTTDVDAAGHGDLVAAGDRLIASNADTMTAVDPVTGSFEAIGGCCGYPIGFDGHTVWLSDDKQVYRVDPDTGDVVATLPYAHAGTVAAIDDRAFLSVASTGVVELDLETNKELRTIDTGHNPIAVRAAEDALWVSDYNASTVTKLQP